MKKLYKKGTVHPTPPLSSDHLSFLPAAIFTLTLALSPDDREVLAYLLSSSTNYSNITNKHTKNIKNTKTSTTSSRSSYSEHAVSFNCFCFRCYMSFWVRWDGSSNREVIHEIIDAFEDGLSHHGRREKGRRERRRKGSRKNGDKGVVESMELSSVKSELSLVEDEDEFGNFDSVESCGDDQSRGVEELEKGSIRRFVSFVGEKIWGGWN